MTHAHAHTARRVGALVVTALAAVLAATPAFGGRRPIIKALAATGADPNAAGRAELQLRRNGNGRFEVIVRHLDPHTTFDVLVDGTKVGSVTTNGHGNGMARFDTKTGGSAQSLGFDPRGRVITVRNADGQDVLSATLPDNPNPNLVPCCASSGDTCAEQTMTACTRAGGTVSDATSCLPNPCSTDSASGAIVCCIPDDSAEGALLRDEGGDQGGNQGGDGEHDHQADCEDDLSQSECAVLGGVVIQGNSCEGNPCAGTTPPTTVTACCVPEHDGDETECEVLTPDRCAMRGGTAASGTTCAGDTCPGSHGHGGRHHHHD